MGPKKHPLQTAEDQALDKAARRRLQCRLAQARYQRTQKGKAAKARYAGSPRHRATTARYRSTTKGQAITKAHNVKRIFVGTSYYGMAQTTALAGVIRQHVKERLRELKQRFKDREKTESVHAGEVPTQAAV